MEPFKQKHFEKTLRVLIYNVLGVVLPFILSLISILLLGKYDKIGDFLDEGQFFLFSAGLLTSSKLLFDENRSDAVKTIPDKIVSFSTIWLLIICSSFYAIIYTLGILTICNEHVHIWLIRIVSVIIFCVAVWSIYRAIYIDSLGVLSKVDVKEEHRSEIDDIMNDLPNSNQ